MHYRHHRLCVQLKVGEVVLKVSISLNTASNERFLSFIMTFKEIHTVNPYIRVILVLSVASSEKSL